jgi:phosphatidate cytidylyltransferase
MIEIVKNFFNQNVYERIISGIIFVIPFTYLIFKGGNYFVLFFVILLVIIIYEFNTSTSKKISLFLRVLITLIFIVSFFHFIFLKIIFDDLITNYLIFIIFSIWIFDSFALIGGRLIGGKKLMPKISPNKTYSGLLTGFISLIFFSIFLIIYCDQNTIIILFTLLIGLISFAGDTIESSLKRFLKIKDFSNFMPGHGGILDRMDAFILFFFIHFLFSIIIFNPIHLYV